MIKGGPLVPAAIFHEFGEWRAEICGRVQPDPDADPLRAGKVLFVWHGFREELDRADYLRRLKLAADPEHPSSQPTVARNLAAEPAIF